MTHDEMLPRDLCFCDICRWANKRIDAALGLGFVNYQELAENYERYLNGDLVAKAESE